MVEKIVVGKQYWAIGFMERIEPCIVVEVKDNIASVKYKIGSSKVRVSDLYKTEEEANEERQKRYRKKEEEIAENINTPEELIKLMFNEMVYGAEFPDGRKIAVAKQKAKEFFGIEL